MSYIDWVDHSSDGGSRDWRSASEIVERHTADVMVRSYGEIIYEDDTKVIIAGNKRLDTDLAVSLYRGYTLIYKKLIVGREE